MTPRRNNLLQDNTVKFRIRISTPIADYRCCKFGIRRCDRCSQNTAGSAQAGEDNRLDALLLQIVKQAWGLERRDMSRDPVKGELVFVIGPKFSWFGLFKCLHDLQEALEAVDAFTGREGSAVCIDEAVNNGDVVSLGPVSEINCDLQRWLSNRASNLFDEQAVPIKKEKSGLRGPVGAWGRRVDCSGRHVDDIKAGC